MQVKAALIAFLLPVVSAMAQVPDTLRRSVITIERDKPMVVNAQGISGAVNTDKIGAVPSFLGNADPVRFVRLLPIVQLNTEMEGGLYMQGSDHSHTLISQEGVPIYGASHLLGLFSIFNTPHYQGMEYTTSTGTQTRLGGWVDMQLPDTLARRFGGEYSVGLMSAQGTLRVPTGSRSALTASVRRTYINLLYKPFLKLKDLPLRYSFTDANLSWLWRPSRTDRVTVDLFGGVDNGRTGMAIIDRVEGRWYNALGAVHWTHYFPDATLKQTAYGMAFGMSPELEAFGVSWALPSFIRDYGYKGALKWKDWEMDANFSYYDIQPQNPSSDGYYASDEMMPIGRQRAWEGSVSASYNLYLGYWTRLKTGAGVNLYHSPDGQFFCGVTPEAELSFDLGAAGNVHLRYGFKRQNLFQVGITNVGLPIEFWLAADSQRPPQYSHNFSLAYNNEFDDRAWSVSAEVYYRRLYNQLEYVGGIMDIYYGEYSLDNSVATGRGRSYGVNLMLQRQKGPVMGWISYSWAPSRHTFDNVRGGREYPCSHERLHELDVVATWHLGKWDLGATFVMATGLPYTAPAAAYVVGNRLVCEYGPYNGARMPAYAKLDLSANYYLKQGPDGKSGFNFSLYNALGRKNATTMGLTLTEDKNTYYFGPMAIYIRFLPSITYFRSF